MEFVLIRNREWDIGMYIHLNELSSITFNIQIIPV